jgi:predicted PurR-regulated permease PerM
MVVYQQFEDRLLIPRVYGQTLRLPTIAVVLALLAGVELLGLIGALLSLPVAAGIRVVVEYFAQVKKESPASEEAEAARAAAEAGPADHPFAPDPNGNARRVGSAPTA